MSAQEVLVGLLEAEHAAVWAYGLLGARLDGRQLDRAREAAEVHRRSRDALLLVVRARGVVPPVPALAYDVRAEDDTEARALALRVEEDLAGRWLDLVSASAEPALRRVAVEGLQGCAARAARWRSYAGTRPTTVPFPGRDQNPT